MISNLNEQMPAIEFNLNQMILDHVVTTIRVCDGNLTQAAILLGISYRTLTGMVKRWRIRQKFNLPPARRGTVQHANFPSAKFALLLEAQARRILELDAKVKELSKQQS